MNKRITSYFAIAPIFAFAMSITGGNALAGGLLSVDFDPDNFPTPTLINNPYWPLLPGNTDRTFIYLGETEDGCAFNKVSVDPDDTKIFSNSEAGYEYYDGFVAQVVLDREWELEDVDCEAVIGWLNADPNFEPDEEDIGEWTFDWYAQDRYENIWYMGEASRDFEEPCPPINNDDGVVGVPIDATREEWSSLYPYSDELYLECTGGSWEPGQLGQEEGEIVGEAGIVVPGDMPTGNDLITPGTYYLQEVAEGAEDMAKILRVNASLSVEDGVSPGDYENCRKVKEWNPFEPGASVEHKWYCTGVNGLVLIQGIGGGPTESEVLVYVQ